MRFLPAAAVLVWLVMVAAAAERQAPRKGTGPPMRVVLPERGIPISVRVVGFPGGAPVLGGSSGTGLLDLGPLSYGGVVQRPNVRIKRSDGHFAAMTTFGLEIRGFSRAGATAAVSAWLTTPDSRCPVRVNGVALGRVAHRIADRVPVGRVSWHQLEIEIPTSLSENDRLLSSGIQFDVVPN